MTEHPEIDLNTQFANLLEYLESTKTLGSIVLVVTPDLRVRQFPIGVEPAELSSMLRSKTVIIDSYCHRTKKKLVLVTRVDGEIKEWVTQQDCTP